MKIKEPIEEIKSTELWKRLNKLSTEYSEFIVKFIQGISPILDSIKIFFPYYTRHDPHHGFRVVKRIEQIINKNANFTEQEIFLLIASAYAHDLGMAVFPDEEDKLLKSLNIPKEEGWHNNKKLLNYLRAEHSKRGEVYINENSDELGVPQNLIKPLAEMMRSHNLSVHELEVKLGQRTAAGEKEINLPQLACILCIGDALEFSDTRVIDGVLDKLKEETSNEAKISYIENMKHICISDSVAIGEDGKVIFSGTFRDPDVLALAHKTIDEIENWVQQYCDIDNRSNIPKLRIMPFQFSRNLEIIGHNFERLGVRLKKENIISLISSNSIWSNDPSVSIRELLQNSVEACRYRDFHTPDSKSYNPKIKVIFDRKNSEITIDDNGCGMSKNVILNNFLTVGNSRSESAAYRSNNYHSLARFGIGFWSVFNIASEVDIETAEFDLLRKEQDVDEDISGFKFSISIDSFKDYTVFKEIQKNSGTKILLKLKKEIQIDNVISLLENKIICSEIEIEIEILNERSLTIPKDPEPLNEIDFFKTRIKQAKDLNVELYSEKLLSDSSEITIALNLAYKIKNDKASFLIGNDETSVMSIINMRFPIISVCGFSLPFTLKNLCFDISRVGNVLGNMKNPKGIKYKLDRNSLLQSEDLSLNSAEITNLIHKSYRNFLKKFKSYSNEDIYKLNKQSRLNGGESHDNYTSNSLSFAFENHPDLICFKLYELEKGKNLQDCNVIYLNLEQILKLDIIIWTSQNPNSMINFYQAIKIMPNIYSFLVESTSIEDKMKNYLIEPCIEGSMLFDNDSSSEIVILNTNQKFDVSLFKINPKNIKINENHSWVIANIKGKWSGTIYEKKITNNIFTFLGRYRLVINKGSELANKIKLLNEENRTFAIAEIANLLIEVENGNISPKLEELFPSIFKSNIT